MPATNTQAEANTQARTARKRNPRGQGERLREDIIEATSGLLADPASPPLTLRAVAREVGVAATSVYLHFDDVASLLLAVGGRRFAELARLQDAAVDDHMPARERLRRKSLAYCEFGLAHPGHYQVMFSPLLDTPEEMPGYQVFRQLADAVAENAGDERTATLLWQQLHGTVSLRIARPRFPWPPLAESVADVVDRIMAGATPGS